MMQLKTQQILLVHLLDIYAGFVDYRLRSTKMKLNMSYFNISDIDAVFKSSHLEPLPQDDPHCAALAPF